MTSTIYSEQLLETIIDELLSGQSLRQLCRIHNLRPHTVLKWVHEDEAFKERYLLARMMYAELLFDEILEIADAPAGDFAEVKKQQLRIDSRKWVLAKMNPKRYGKQITIDDLNPTRPKQLVIVTTDKDVINDDERETMEFIDHFLPDTLREKN